VDWCWENLTGSVRRSLEDSSEDKPKGNDIKLEDSKAEEYKTPSGQKTSGENKIKALQEKMTADMSVGSVERESKKAGKKFSKLKRAVKAKNEKSNALVGRKEKEKLKMIKDELMQENSGKRMWGNGDELWLKRRYGKRMWDDTGEEWLKRGGKRMWGDSGDEAWLKKRLDKRMWGDTEEAWLKRNNGKRMWSDSGEAWLKRVDAAE